MLPKDINLLKFLCKQNQQFLTPLWRWHSRELGLKWPTSCRNILGSYSSQGPKREPQGSAPQAESHYTLVLRPDHSENGSWQTTYFVKMYIKQNVPFLTFLSVQFSSIKYIHMLCKPNYATYSGSPRTLKAVHGMFSLHKNIALLPTPQPSRFLGRIPNESLLFSVSQNTSGIITQVQD